MKLKKGDKIKIMSGKDKGREGVIERVYAKQDTVLVPGVNLYKRHIKKSEKVPQGGVVDIPRALNIAKVMLVCPKCGKPTKVAYQINKNSKKRMCKKCKQVFN